MLHRHRLIFLHMTLGSYDNDFYKKGYTKGSIQIIRETFGCHYQ